jgi:serine/threonine protein kinase
MRYFHMTGGMHRDLKPANILLDDKNEIRVADFGSARFSNVQATLTSAVGTPWYMAPEVGEGDYDQSVDLFSFAIILWELITGKTMNRQFAKEFMGPIAWLGKVKNGTRPPTTGLSPLVVDLLTGCWDSGPLVRVTFDAVIEALKRMNYQLLDGVDAAAVKEYVARIEEYEEEYPPEPLDV